MSLVALRVVESALIWLAGSERYIMITNLVFLFTVLQIDVSTVISKCVALNYNWHEHVRELLNSTSYTHASKFLRLLLYFLVTTGPSHTQLEYQSLKEHCTVVSVSTANHFLLLKHYDSLVNSSL